MLIPRESYLKGLYIDIETVGITETLSELQSKNPKLADLWEKRCVWLRKNAGPDLAAAADDLLWEEKSSLHPEFSKIVCVSIGAFKGEVINIRSYYGDNEKEILTNVNKVLQNAKMSGLTIAGHTIKSFDIPFIGKRMVINGISPSSYINFFGKKPWEISVMDISEIFSFGSIGQSHVSLDLMCCVLGIDSPKDCISGKDVHSQYYQGNIEKIKTYCEKDIEATVACFGKLSLE